MCRLKTLRSLYAARSELGSGGWSVFVGMTAPTRRFCRWRRAFSLLHLLSPTTASGRKRGRPRPARLTAPLSINADRIGCSVIPRGTGPQDPEGAVHDKPVVLGGAAGVGPLRR